jgi:hypothetical protein
VSWARCCIADPKDKQRQNLELKGRMLYRVRTPPERWPLRAHSAQPKPTHRISSTLSPLNSYAYDLSIRFPSASPAGRPHASSRCRPRRDRPFDAAPCLAREKGLGARSLAAEILLGSEPRTQWKGYGRS